jgi:hypothetical protein
MMDSMGRLGADAVVRRLPSLGFGDPLEVANAICFGINLDRVVTLLPWRPTDRPEQILFLMCAHAFTRVKGGA